MKCFYADSNLMFFAQYNQFILIFVVECWAKILSTKCVFFGSVLAKEEEREGERV